MSRAVLVLVGLRLGRRSRRAGLHPCAHTRPPSRPSWSRASPAWHRRPSSLWWPRERCARSPSSLCRASCSTPPTGARSSSSVAAELGLALAIGGAAMCVGAAVVVGSDGRPTGERWDDVPAGPFGLPTLYEHNPIPVSSALMRRSALHAAGGYGGAFPDYAEDWDLWLRLARRDDTLLSVPQARIRYRRQPGSMTTDAAS